ncbi:isopentenyl-diphosphate Delta-isomerase [Polymorphospora rubra]|uniref:isopentenyl-diphosphate Delta-isomerase n=1 Tax=Polymorphospora rubra TaxID=338584 RepID=UPI0033D378EB
MTLSREAHLVELVSDTGNPIGECTVDEAHRPPGRLHRAFSVFLVDPTGRVLLQQRAAVKTRFPLRWANSCCGHPAPGQSLGEAANRRLGEELGLPPVELTEVGVYVYYAEDPATGRVEFEYDHVLRGELAPDVPLAPAPEEVADLRWVTREELLAGLAEHPRQHAPWLAGVADRLFSPGRTGTDRVVVPESGAVEEAPERSGGR